MYKRIFKEIKKYNTIVIARHIGVDPDAMASQVALRDSIKLTFPEKNVYAIGTGSAKFTFLGKLDKVEKFNNALLIVTDTPDKRRVDTADVSQFAYSIKIDHHPFIEKFCDLELIEDTASSACEIIMKLILETKLACNESIAKLLFMGLVSDSNRFLFNSCTASTFALVSHFLGEYKFDITPLYQQLYARPLNEVRLEGYILSNMVVSLKLIVLRLVIWLIILTLSMRFWFGLLLLKMLKTIRYVFLFDLEALVLIRLLKNTMVVVINKLLEQN